MPKASALATEVAQLLQRLGVPREAHTGGELTVRSPVSGEVVAVNADLANHPDHVNSKPHETWMIRVKVADAAETSSLLDSTAYEALTK